MTGKRDPFEVARRRMVTEQLVAGGIKSSRVLEVMGRVPRHAYVGRGLTDQAYFDRPLAIGVGQTISQPFMVAIMTEALDLQATDKILEIGTGSGYQTAILAELAGEVYSIERIKTLSIAARKVLYRFHYRHIHLRIGDGSLGWPEAAPFDGIIVTAGAPIIPEALKNQLKDDGRLVIPVGGSETQELMVIRRRGTSFQTTNVTGCRFVKLVGEQGWKENSENGH